MWSLGHSSLSSEQNVRPIGSESNRWIERLKAVWGGTALCVGLVAVILALSPRIAAAQPSSTCAWPFEITPHGAGNWAWPDTIARYWAMPFDAQYVQMTIHGTYPIARYMSFVAYNGEVPTSTDGWLYDAQIAPDPGSSNPFAPPGGSGGTYTVTVVRGQSPGGNVIGALPGFEWVVLRVYVPDEGENSMGGVPLPRITLTDGNGNTESLPQCSPINAYSDLSDVLNVLFPFALPVPTTTSSTRLWFAPPDNPPERTFPNPDNKYVNAVPELYQPGRIIVIRGKAPGFPDTYRGSPVWQPVPRFKAVQLRYWSLCVNDFTVPFPAVQCMTDLNARLDRHRFYSQG